MGGLGVQQPFGEALHDDFLAGALADHVHPGRVQLGVLQPLLYLLPAPRGRWPAVIQLAALGLAAIQRPQVRPPGRLAQLGQELPEDLGGVEVVLGAAHLATPALVKRAGPSTPQHRKPVVGVTRETG